MKRFRLDTNGSVLVEALLAMPILVFFTFGIVQIGMFFFIWSTMHEVARHVSRDISVGTLDDETNGVMTACGALSGTSADGRISAEQMACNRVSVVPGNFFVSASDGVANAPADSAALVSVRLEATTASISAIDILGLVTKYDRIAAGAHYIKE